MNKKKIHSIINPDTKEPKAIEKLREKHKEQLKSMISQYNKNGIEEVESLLEEICDEKY